MPKSFKKSNIFKIFKEKLKKFSIYFKKQGYLSINMALKTQYLSRYLVRKNFLKKIKKSLKKVLTFGVLYGIIYEQSTREIKTKRNLVDTANTLV